MSTVDKKPTIVNFGRGKLTNTAITLNNEMAKIDLFNGTKETFQNYQLQYDVNTKKYKLGDFKPFDENVNINYNVYQSTMYLNGPEVKAKTTSQIEFIVGTHIGEQTLNEGLDKKRISIKMDNYTIDTKLNFIYVQMTTGVPETTDYDKKYRKTSQNTISAQQIKDSAGNLRVGFSHYLTGYPTETLDDAKELGKKQAQKFLEAILGPDKNITKNRVLDGCMPPMVVMLDNVTEVNYYGPAPIGVLKNLENF